MFAAVETVPAEELALRWARCRTLLDRHLPEAGGLLVFSRVAIYWLTGHLGNGLFWLPREGAPVLLCRKGEARARLESPLETIFPFRSYRDVRGLLEQAGSPLAPVAACEMSGLPWSFGLKLEQELDHGTRLVPGDTVLALGRMKKTAWELDKLRL